MNTSSDTNRISTEAEIPRSIEEEVEDYEKRRKSFKLHEKKLATIKTNYTKKNPEAKCKC